MSISSVQYARKKKEFIRILLEKGIEPNNFELNKLLAEYFDVHTPGMPCYSPVKQEPYSESDKDGYNHNFSTLAEDMETVYRADMEINNKAVAMQEYYNLERNKVRNAVAKLALRVDSITDALRSACNAKYFTEAFDDLYNVEFYGDKKRNIPYTTSFVDLMQKKAYTDRPYTKAGKIQMGNASVSFDGLSYFTGYSTKGDIMSILNDTVDEIYMVYACSATDGSKTVTVNIDIGDSVTFNEVSMSFTSITPMLCCLYVSDDNVNFIPAYDISTRDFAEWNFNAKTARYIRVTCTKKEPDGTEGNETGSTSYEYYFLFKNISVMYDEFEQKSVFVSKQIDFDDLTSTVRLDACDMVFANTRIDYFIGFDNGTDKIGWDAIKNHEDHKLFMFEKRHKILNAHIPDFGTQGVQTHLYKIYELPDGVNRNSIRVTAGYNMWHVKRYKRKSGDCNDGFSISSGDFSDHVAKCNMDDMFMDCENYDGFNIQSNVLYIFTQYVSLQESRNLFGCPLNVTDTGYVAGIKGAEIRVFLNGYETTATDGGRYSFALKKGVNKIQAAIYVPHDKTMVFKLLHGINFKALSNDVFACTPMKYTTATILDKMHGDTYEYYTIKDNYVYVKCDPACMISSRTEDMGYFISYYMLREDMRSYFPGNHVRFRIMAVLHSNDRNVSPAILNYRITGR